MFFCFYDIDYDDVLSKEKSTQIYLMDLKTILRKIEHIITFGLLAIESINHLS